MAKSKTSKRATVHDVARRAGVSLATVDRVLNGRPGVRPATIARVDKAIAALDFRRDVSASLLARSRDISIVFLLPEGANPFMRNLADAVERQVRAAASERMHIAISPLRAFDSMSLVGALKSLTPETCNCAIVVATDNQATRIAVDDAIARGIKVMTLVSDLPGSDRAHFIGIDNRAAGRTAAGLMGRFCPAGGKIGLVVGSLDLRDHRERYEGFREIARSEFPALQLVGPEEGYDEPATTGAAISSLVADHPDLAGVYSIGAGNDGLIDALNVTGRAGQLRVIVHELTEATQKGLKSGAVDVVIDQNPEGEIRAAIAAARALALGSPPGGAEPITIGIFLRDNLR